MKLTYYIFIIFSLFIVSQSCSEDLVDKIQSGTLKGKAVKKGTNIPLANVKITTSPTTETIFTATDGTFTISEMPIGDYSVKAELTGYLGTFQGITIGKESQTVSIVFEMSDDNSLNSPPSTPQLISPVDNAVDQPLSVNLVWSSTDPDADDVLKYTLILKNDKNTNITKITDITQSNYTISNLAFGVNYFWQIIVNDGVNNDVYSEIRTFKTSSTPDNRFHFVRNSGGNSYIVSNDETNTNAFNLTNSTNNSFRPRYNHNVGLIAFLRTVGSNSQIFTVKRDGTQETQVTQIPVAGFNNNELDFSWNTSGSELLYANFNKLYKINKDGSGITLLYSTTDGNIISECDWSYDGSKIAIKTNNYYGYNAKILIIDTLGNELKTILTGVNGAVGGLNFSVDGKSLLYCYDISDFQDSNYRRLNSHLFIYNLGTDVVRDLSNLSKKPTGTNDLDPRFSPNNAEIIFVNTSNDGVSQKSIIKIPVESVGDYNRTVLFTNAEMPDYE